MTNYDVTFLLLTGEPVVVKVLALDTFRALVTAVHASQNGKTIPAGAAVSLVEVKKV